MYVDQALETFDETPVELTARRLPDTPMGHLAANYILILLQGDRRRASRLILDTLDQGQDVCDLYLHVLLPAQEELGRMWLSNEINVAEEHFASHTTKMVMAQLLPHATIQPSNGKTMLAAAVAGNQHDIGLQAVADFFEMDGWRTISLGANVPARDLAEAVSVFHPDLLGVSISQTTQLNAAKVAVEAARTSSQGAKFRIILGGRALFDDGKLAGELGADGCAGGPKEAIRLGRQLVGLPPEAGDTTGS
jgi:methanogenic corrinoid protein MtbC1